MLYSLEWYLNQLMVIVAAKMGLKDSESFSPFELNDFIQRNIQIYDMMNQFIEEYTEWYNYHKDIEEKRIECDILHLAFLSNRFKKTRISLLAMAEESNKN